MQKIWPDARSQNELRECIRALQRTLGSRKTECERARRKRVRKAAEEAEVLVVENSRAKYLDKQLPNPKFLMCRRDDPDYKAVREKYVALMMQNTKDAEAEAVPLLETRVLQKACGYFKGRGYWQKRFLEIILLSKTGGLTPMSSPWDDPRRNPPHPSSSSPPLQRGSREMQSWRAENLA